MLVVFEISMTSSGVDRWFELFVVLSGVVRDVFFALSFPELLDCEFVENGERAG